MKKVNSLDKLIKVKVSDKDSHLLYNVVDVGFLAVKNLKELLGKKTVSCLQKIAEKLLEKSPIQFVLTRTLTCLDCRKM